MALAHGLPVAHLGFDAAINQDVRGLLVAPGFDPRFVYYALLGRRRELDQHIDRAAHGTARVRDTLYSHRLDRIPDATKQRAIARFLDHEMQRLDNAAALANQWAVKAASRTREVRAELLGFAAVQGELAGADGPPRPRLKHVVDKWSAGATPTSTNPEYWVDPPEGTPWVAIGDISGRRYVEATARALTDEGLAATGQVVAPAGTLLFAMYASVGEIAELGRPAAFNQAMLGLTVNDPVDRAFLVEWLMMLRPLLTLFARSNTQDNLNADAVRNLPYTTLGPAERAAAVARLRAVEQEERVITSSVLRIANAVSEYGESLIHDAVTGKLDVTRVSETQMEERLHAASEGRLDEVSV
jgi:hypothetical protein